ncbi:hypothetical protein DYB30_002930 [Aphanomyces astaci]|uniref:EF-hand domain-containing protein n=2 Tax=Aphanomyces astaci TaxID=112090 RepID=A0A397DRS6_APHAT|nr:hypothetical protein DYB30_002930 [Aphanomyces astaci]
MLSVEDKNKVIKASWLVEDAFRGFSRAHPKVTPQAVQVYKIYHRLVIVRHATVFVLLMLSFVETPYWCHGTWPHPCGDPLDPSTPLTSGMLLLARGKSVLVEVTCLAICLVNDGLLYHSLGRNFFTRLDRYPSIHTLLSAWQLLILLTTANFPDIMMPAYTRNRAYGLFFIVFVAFGLFFMMNLILAQVFNNFQRIAASDEAKAVTNRAALLSQAFDLLVTIQADRHHVGLLGRGSPPSSPGSPGRRVLAPPTSASPSSPLTVRGSSSPPKRQQVGMPPPSPLHEEPSVCCNWIDTNLALSLFQELNHYNVASTRLSHKHMLDLFYQLDTDGDGRIELRDFFAVCDCMREYVQTYHKSPSEIERWWPRVAATRRFQQLCTIVTHKRFELAIDSLLILNALCIVLETSTTTDNTASSRAWGIAQVVFSSLYVVEMMLKIAVCGWRDYMHSFRNRFDAAITIGSLVVDICAEVPNTLATNHTVPKVLMTCRCLRMLRLFLSIERYRVILHTAWAMVPIGKNLLLVMFCNMNVFALVGHQLFGGRISPALLNTAPFANSTYAAAGYAANNFNDVPSGMVTLFELLVVNNWFVIVEGHVLVTSAWVRVFFIAFWLTGVIMTLNLIVASILDAFSKEYAAAAAITDAPKSFDSPLSCQMEMKSFVVPPTSSPSQTRLTHQRMVAFASSKEPNGGNDLLPDECRSA